MLFAEHDFGLITLGDSNTLGQGASTPPHCYANRLAAYLGGPLVNLAVSGQGTTVAARSALGTVGRRRAVMTCFAGLNDLRRNGVASKAKIVGNIRAIICAAFTANSYSAGSLKRAGTWQPLDPSVGGRGCVLGPGAVYTNDTGAVAEFEIAGGDAVIGGMATNNDPTVSSSQSRDLLVSVDGGATRSLPIMGATDEAYSYTAHTVSGSPSGLHRVRITPSTSLPWSIIDYVGVLNAFGQGPLLIGHIPYVTNWASVGPYMTKAVVDEVNSALDAVVAEFPQLPVEIVRTNDAFNAADSCVSDGVHWSDSMHFRVFELCKAQLSFWN